MYWVLNILKLTKGCVWIFLEYCGTAPANLGDCCGLNLTQVFCWYAGGEINWFCGLRLFPVGEL